MSARATVAHVFDTMAERFRPEAAAGIDAVIVYDVSGEGGARRRIVVKGAKVRVEEIAGEAGEAGAATLRIATDAATFLGINLGEVDGPAAFLSGKVAIEGDVGLASSLPRLFQKYVPPREGGAVTPAAIVASLPERFRADRAPGRALTIGYDVTGEGGGRWTARIASGSCRVEPGLAADAMLTQVVSAADFVALVTGGLDPLAAITSGKLVLQGDMEVAALLPKMFARYQLPGAVESVQEELVTIKRLISVDMRYSVGSVMGRFLDGLVERRILANVCPRCGRKQVPPREVCALCRCRAIDFAEVGPEGVLVFIDTIYYASPDPLTGRTRETPYGDIRVLLDGCSGTETFWHVIRKEDLFRVKRGDRLRPVWAPHRAGAIEDIVHFEMVERPAGEAAAVPVPAAAPDVAAPGAPAPQTAAASSDERVKLGKLALPYQYFAGRVGSRFLVALRERRKILAVRCERCERTFVPPRQSCARCFSSLEGSWVELPGGGTVVHATVVRYEAPHLPRKPPYVLALIKLDGADTPLLHVVDGDCGLDVAPGLRVAPVFAAESGGTILDIDHFAPER